MKEDVLFKKTPFGGFDREQVIDYVQQLKQTQLTHKSLLEEKEALNKKLIAENEEYKQKNSDMTKELNRMRQHDNSIEIENKNLRVKNDILEKKIENFDGDEELAADTIKTCNSLVDAATETAKQVENNTREKILKVIKTIDSNKNLSKIQVTQMLVNLIQELN